MALQEIFPKVHALLLSIVYVYFIDEGDSLTLIDAAVPNQEDKILAAAASLGKPIRNIVLTHNHPDHVGSLAALKAKTGATTWIHPLERPVLEGKVSLGRPKPAPGFIYWLMTKTMAATAQFDPVVPDREINDGEVLPFGGGMRVYHTPGHAPGHCALLLERDGGLLFAGDTCADLFGVGYSIVYDDFDEAMRSLKKLRVLSPKTVCFGHGKATTGDKFKARWNKLA